MIYVMYAIVLLGALMVALGARVITNNMARSMIVNYILGRHIIDRNELEKKVLNYAIASILVGILISFIMFVTTILVYSGQ